MSITIFSRWDSKRALYVAEGAPDVRVALEEAVQTGAYLGGADLRGAYLGRANLRGADLGDADLRRADLGGADLGDAYLGGADLRGADLGRADLRRADLRGAYLGGADLGGAYLGGADLRGAYLGDAKGFRPEWCNDLLILQDQVGKIRAYKLVNEKGEGPFNGGIVYEQGKTYEVKKPNCDPAEGCGAGINLATLPWCISNWSPGYRILVCEFTRADIAAIPLGDGKFRVAKCKVVGEKDCAALGLGVQDEAKAEVAA